MASGNGGGEELNLTAYMDIIVTLVLCMVFTVSLMADFSAAEVDVPTGHGAGGSAVNVVINAEGFEVRQDGAKLALARGADWPYADLSAVLRQLHDAEATPPALTLSPGAAVPYKVVVATLDALRTDEMGPLFPDVALAIAAR